MRDDLTVQDDSPPTVEQGAELHLNFSLALTSGEVIDSNFDRPPVSFRLGDGSMLPCFEEKLLGLTAGAEVDCILPPEQAFGEPNPGNRQHFTAEKFKELTSLLDDEAPIKAGSVILFRDPAGANIPGVVQEISADTVLVDFNHPLAGRDIVFKARIDRVLPPDVSSLQIK